MNRIPTPGENDEFIERRLSDRRATPTDTEMLDWIILMLDGGPDADERTVAMALAMTQGLRGRSMLQAAMRTFNDV